MRSSIALGAACLACLALSAAAVALVEPPTVTVALRAKLLVTFYGSRCALERAFRYDGTIVAVCRQGHLQPFYGNMPCTEPPLACRVGIWPLCYEPGPAVVIPPGRAPGTLGSLLP